MMETSVIVYLEAWALFAKYIVRRIDIVSNTEVYIHKTSVGFML